MRAPAERFLLVPGRAAQLSLSPRLNHNSQDAPRFCGPRSSFRFSPVRLRSRCGLIGSYRLACESRRRAAVGAGGRSKTRYRGGGSGRAVPSWAPSLICPPFSPSPHLWFPRRPRRAARRRQAPGEGLWSVRAFSRAKR